MAACVLSIVALIVTAGAFFLMAVVFNEVFPVIGAVFSSIFYFGVLLLALGAAGIALLVGLLLRPIASLYAKILREEPISQAGARAGGAALLALGIGMPAAFLKVLFETTTSATLIGTFLGAVLSPFLLRAGWGLLRVQPPLVV